MTIFVVKRNVNGLNNRVNAGTFRYARREFPTLLFLLALLVLLLISFLPISRDEQAQDQDQEQDWKERHLAFWHLNT